MKLKKLVCSVISAVMLMSGVGMMNVSADIDTGSLISYDGDEYYDGDGEPVEPTTYYSVYDFIERLYSLALQRESDQAGRQSWADVLYNQKGTGISVAYGFIYSNEFQSRDISNEDYVELMYQMFFGRASDPAGKAGWVNVLNSMGRDEGRLDVFNGFANSNEFFELCNLYGIVAGTFVPGENVDRVANVNLFVNRMYSIVLHRECDKTGMANWTDSLLAGESTGAQVGYGFFFSDEYLNRNYGDSSYIIQLYSAFMGREADDAGLNAWILELSSGESREHVFNGFTQSQEFSNICAAYGILRGDPIPEPASQRRGTTNDTNVLRVWSSTRELETLAEQYSDVPIEFTLIDGSAYLPALDAALMSGAGAPDVVFLDVQYVPRMIENEFLLPVTSLGISDSDMSDMYPYTLDLARSNGEVYALSYQICPCVVFYNRNVASRTLGVSQPEQVAPYFASWDSFLNTARTVRDASGGNMRIVSGLWDATMAYQNQRTHSWADIVNGTSDDAVNGSFDFARILHDEELTFECSQWTEEWTNQMKNNTVLSYYGPDWLARYSMGLGLPDVNPTSGQWGVVAGPNNWYWGGSYIAATFTCRNRELAGQFIRDITLNPEAGASVSTPNSRSTISAWASDPAHNEAMFGGQNPYGIYNSVASNISVTPVESSSSDISAYFSNYVTCYAYGELTRDQAMQNFRSAVTDNVYG